MPEEAATLAAGVAGATTTSGEKNKLENALTASKVARAGGPASTSFKVIDETSVTVPSKLPAVNRVAMSRPTGPEVAEAARRLDIDLVFDADLLYIAEELLMSPVPEVGVRGDAERKKVTHTCTQSSTRVAVMQALCHFYHFNCISVFNERERVSLRVQPVRSLYASFCV